MAEEAIGGLEPGCIEWMHKEKQGPDEFLEIHLTPSYFLCSFFTGHLDEFQWTRTNGLFSSHQESPFLSTRKSTSGTRKPSLFPL